MLLPLASSVPVTHSLYRKLLETVQAGSRGGPPRKVPPVSIPASVRATSSFPCGPALPYFPLGSPHSGLENGVAGTSTTGMTSQSVPQQASTPHGQLSGPGYYEHPDLTIGEPGPSDPLGGLFNLPY